MRKFWAENQQESLIILISILLLADVIIFGIGSAFAIKILPVILTILAAMIIFVWQLDPKKKLIIASLIFILSYVFALLAINIFFNDLRFGNLLGYKILDVPFLIGVLWLVVVISCWHIVSYRLMSKYKKYILGIFVLFVFDLILKQFANNLDLWSSAHSQVGVEYYIFWVVLSGLAFLLIDKVAGIFKPSLFVASLLPILAIYFWLIMLF